MRSRTLQLWVEQAFRPAFMGLKRVCHSDPELVEGEESAFHLPNYPFTYLRNFAILVLAVLITGLPLLAADQSARFDSLGHRMICGCGCNQILLECNHVGCPLSDGMRAELSSALARGDSDDLILQAFVQKYGPTILAAPPATGFNRVAWIMPFAVLLLAIGTAALVIKNWKHEPQPADAAALPSGLQEQIRRETEL